MLQDPREVDISAFRGLQGSYSAAEISILEAVYEEICRELGVDPNQLDGEYGGEARALVIALIDATQFDEFDPKTLKARALSALGGGPQNAPGRRQRGSSFAFTTSRRMRE
jgi:hypothetical protein